MTNKPYICRSSRSSAPWSGDFKPHIGEDNMAASAESERDPGVLHHPVTRAETGDPKHQHSQHRCGQSHALHVIRCDCYSLYR